MRSEFGRGYAVCLLQFLFHEARLREYVDLYAKLRVEKYDPAFPTMWDETSAVEMFANGAADHLVDIIRPRRWITRSEWARAKALSDLIYFAGRQYRADQKYTAGEMRSALSEAESLLHSYSHAAQRPMPRIFQEAWDFDVAAGLKPERGNAATCEEPIRMRQRA